MQSKYIQSSKELTFDKFQKIAVEGDLRVLIIEGTPDASDLLIAWENIYWEYTQKIDNDFNALVDNRIKLLIKKIKINLVKCAIDILTWCNSDELIKMLKKFGFDGEFDFNNEEAFKNDLKRVSIQLRFWEMEIPKEDNKANKVVDKLDYDVFIIALSNLSSYVGYDIKAKEITTYEFAVRYNMMLKEIKKRNTKWQTNK